MKIPIKIYLTKIEKLSNFANNKHNLDNDDFYGKESLSDYSKSAIRTSLIQIMSDTPIVQNKVINNDSGILTGTYAYSPHPLPPNDVKLESNSAESIEKILSTSIQRAKQKITMLEGRQREERGQGRQERASSKEGNSQGSNSALATAMKVLQSRVYELQKLVQGLEREKGIVLKELDNTTSEKKILLSNLQEANRKVVQLEHTLKASKAEVKDLNRKLEDASSKTADLQGRCEGLQMTIRHLQNDKQQMSMSLSRRDQQQSSLRQSPSHKQLMIKSAELQERTKAIHEKQRKLQQKQKRFGLIEGELRQRESKLVIEGFKLKSLIDQNTQLKSQLERATRELSQTKGKQISEKESYETYLRKINDMQSQIEMLRETTKRLEVEKQPEHEDEAVETMRDQLRGFESKYEELLHLYRRAEEKGRRDQKQNKLVKERVRQIEDLLSEIVEKIGKLPTCTKDLKYLCVKAAKLMAANAERAITLKTPTKSRSNSLNRSISRSNSQRKITQHSQLENYENSNRSNKGQSGSKQKKVESNSKRKSSGSKSKRVVVSQTGWEGTEKEVTELKKEYKKLVKQLNETESEEIRNRLNDLAFIIQEKSEKVTKLKQNRAK